MASSAQSVILSRELGNNKLNGIECLMNYQVHFMIDYQYKRDVL